MTHFGYGFAIALNSDAWADIQKETGISDNISVEDRHVSLSMLLLTKYVNVSSFKLADHSDDLAVVVLTSTVEEAPYFAITHAAELPHYQTGELVDALNLLGLSEYEAPRWLSWS